jgi:hypothetical protein
MLREDQRTKEFPFIEVIAEGHSRRGQRGYVVFQDIKPCGNSFQRVLFPDRTVTFHFEGEVNPLTRSIDKRALSSNYYDAYERYLRNPNF